MPREGSLTQQKLHASLLGKPYMGQFALDMSFREE